MSRIDHAVKYYTFPIGQQAPWVPESVLHRQDICQFAGPEIDEAVLLGDLGSVFGKSVGVRIPPYVLQRRRILARLKHMYEHIRPCCRQSRLQVLSCHAAGYFNARSRCLGQYNALIKVVRVESLNRHASVWPSLPYGMLNWRRALQIGKKRWVYIETTKRCARQKPRWDKQAKGDGDDEMERSPGRPAGEGVERVGG